MRRGSGAGPPANSTSYKEFSTLPAALQRQHHPVEAEFAKVNDARLGPLTFHFWSGRAEERPGSRSAEASRSPRRSAGLTAGRRGVRAPVRRARPRARRARARARLVGPAAPAGARARASAGRRGANHAPRRRKSTRAGQGALVERLHQQRPLDAGEKTVSAGPLRGRVTGVGGDDQLHRAGASRTCTGGARPVPPRRARAPSAHAQGVRARAHTHRSPQSRLDSSGRPGSTRATTRWYAAAADLADLGFPTVLGLHGKRDLFRAWAAQLADDHPRMSGRNCGGSDRAGALRHPTVAK